MEGDLRQEPGVHDAAEVVRGMCHGNGCRQETPVSTPYLAQRRDGALSLTIGCSTEHWPNLFARAMYSLLLKIHGPSDRELVDKTAD